MNKIKATDLWQKGKTFCAAGHYKKGLGLMEEAFSLNPSTYQGLLGSFYLHLYNDLRSGFISVDNFCDAEFKDLWQRGTTLLFNAQGVWANDLQHPAKGADQEPLVPEPKLKLAKKAPGYCGGPVEGWHRTEHDFKKYSMFAPIDLSTMGSVVEPDPENLKPLHGAALLDQLLWPCVIIIVIQGFIYLSLLFFSYLGDYMGR